MKHLQKKQQKEELESQMPSLITSDEYTFWISGNVPSSKNSRVWTGDFFHSSPATQKWRRTTKLEWRYQAIWFQYLLSMLPQPYYIELTFVRKSRNKFDYINIAQAIMDEMVFHGAVTKEEIQTNDPAVQVYFGWLPEDNASVVKPYFGDFIYDKENPGVIIRILKNKPSHDIQEHTRTDYRLLQQSLHQSILNSNLVTRRSAELFRQARESKTTRRRVNPKD